MASFSRLATAYRLKAALSSVPPINDTRLLRRHLNALYAIHKITLRKGGCTLLEIEAELTQMACNQARMLMFRVVKDLIELTVIEKGIGTNGRPSYYTTLLGANYLSTINKRLGS